LRDYFHDIQAVNLEGNVILKEYCGHNELHKDFISSYMSCIIPNIRNALVSINITFY